MTADTPAPVRRPLFRLPIKAAIYLLLGYWVAVWTVAGFSAIARYRLGTPLPPLPDTPELVVVAYAVATLGYAAMRAGLFHPSLRPAYAAWVAASPWRPGRPLPVGPPQLVWEDAVPAAVLAALCPNPVIPLAVFVGAFLALAGRVGYRGRDGRWLGYVAANAIAGLILAWPHPAVAGTILVGLLVMADGVIRRSLADLPWVTPVADAARAEAAKRAESQWPLVPVEPPAPVPTRHAWGIAASAAWMAYCLTTVNLEHTRKDEMLLVIAFAVLGMAGLVRWVAYCGQYQPPISTWGRLWTGRFVIPGYDRAVVAPLVAMALSAAVPFAGYAVGLAVPVSIACATFAVLAVAIGAGPTLRDWQLTGHHRIVVRRPRTTAAGKRAA